MFRAAAALAVIMDVLLTGGTGYIGSAVLAALRAKGHTVTAVVRSETAAATVQAAGADPIVGDLTDVDWLADQLRETDGAIHTASPGGPASADVDRAVATAVVQAYGGTAAPYVHTGGLWSYGSGTGLVDDSPLDPPALTAWRSGVEAVVLDADLVATVLAPAVVYGHGAGLPGLVVDAPRADDALVLLGDGSTHWGTVHVDDLADLYVRVLESGVGHGRVLGVAPGAPTVAEIAEATGTATVPESVESTRERLGAAFADALLLDQRFGPDLKAYALGWTPTRPSLVDEIRAGGYA